MSKLFKKKKRTRIISEKVKNDMEELSKKTEDERIQIVFEKLLNSSKYNVSSVDLKKVRTMSKNLSLEESLKESKNYNLKKDYLNKDFKAVKEYFQILEIKENKNLFESQNTSKIESFQIEKEEEKEEEKEIEFPEDLQILKTNEKIKIKLVITEIHQTENERVLRKLCSPFASAFNLSPEFGNSLISLNFSRIVSFCTFYWTMVFGMDE
jgi:hypothetical protein